MASVSRTSQFAKVTKVLKKHYKPVGVDAQRPVLEHLLFACCLENAHYEPAEETYAAIKNTFFDLNEIRVTSISELSEVLLALPDPRAAANRLKRVLQAIFEATYSFDLEEHRKKNLGPTVKWLGKLDGTTKFSVAYVVQSALGGHSIPIDSGVLSVLRICNLITDKDVGVGTVPGLERAISKAKGIEFGSMLHQFGADFTANPYSPAVREVLLQIDPDCKDRFPKRRTGKKAKASKEGSKKTAAGDKKAKTQKTAKKSKAKPAAGKKKSSKGKTASSGLSKRKPR